MRQAAAQWVDPATRVGLGLDLDAAAERIDPAALVGGWPDRRGGGAAAAEGVQRAPFGLPEAGEEAAERVGEGAPPAGMGPGAGLGLDLSLLLLEQGRTAEVRTVAEEMLC